MAMSEQKSKILYLHETAVHNKRAAAIVLPLLFKLYQPASLLDVGCGLGSWMAVAAALGVKECVGVDAPPVPKDKLFVPEKTVLEHNLTAPFSLGRRFDLVLCLEVIEHLPESSEDTLLKTITEHADVVL